MRYDNIEIGTSDFSTLIQSANGNGMSIEPVPVYFKQLPDREAWVKINAAVSNIDGKADLYYVDPDRITTQGNWVRGCNSIGRPHPTIFKLWPWLMEKIEVDCIRMKTICETYNISEIGYLKIDTEGHDYIILNDFLDCDLPLPEKLQFESNRLSDPEEYGKLIERLIAAGYTTHMKGSDTICTL